MATGVVTWSQTAASNATADGNVNWAEGMAPSQVNDSARAAMASVAKWRDELNGFSNFTGGSGGAYTLTSQQGFASFAAMHTARFTLFLNATNTSSNPTLNVDGLGGKIMWRDASGTNIPIGCLRVFDIIDVTYNNNGPAFIVHNGNSLVESGRISASGVSTSNTPPGWLFCDGSAISRTTFAALFNAIGVAWGNGDGSTTFNIPDLRGRALFGVDATGVRLSGAASVGVTGGAATVTLSTGNIPQLPLSGTSITGTQSLGNLWTTPGGSQQTGGGGTGMNQVATTVNGSNFSVSGGTVGNASPSSFAIIPNAATVNYIIKT